jgi:hypothetical protein
VPGERGKCYKKTGGPKSSHLVLKLYTSNYDTYNSDAIILSAIFRELVAEFSVVFMLRGGRFRHTLPPLLISRAGEKIGWCEVYRTTDGEKQRCGKTDIHRVIMTVLQGYCEGASDEKLKVLCTHVCNAYTERDMASFVSCGTWGGLGGKPGKEKCRTVSGGRNRSCTCNIKKF